MGSSETIQRNTCFLDDHFYRLWSAAKATGIKLPYSKKN